MTFSDESKTIIAVKLQKCLLLCKPPYQQAVEL